MYLIYIFSGINHYLIIQQLYFTKFWMRSKNDESKIDKLNSDEIV